MRPTGGAPPDGGSNTNLILKHEINQIRRHSLNVFIVATKGSVTAKTTPSQKKKHTREYFNLTFYLIGACMF